MIEKIRASWRSYPQKRRDYQIDRALYKSGGGRGARHGGFEGEAGQKPENLGGGPGAGDIGPG